MTISSIATQVMSTFCSEVIPKALNSLLQTWRITMSLNSALCWNHRWKTHPQLCQVSASGFDSRLGVYSLNPLLVRYMTVFVFLHAGLTDREGETGNNICFRRESVSLASRPYFSVTFNPKNAIALFSEKHRNILRWNKKKTSAL